ncbi:chaplin family protein [Streptomyces achromogenes]|uniref:chaplin family protein n=1 Tax=Streptomyces achromogenes TaxID=67255 RepID=UPI0036AD5303
MFLTVLGPAALLPGTARAGGIVDILAPAFGNGCTNHYQPSTSRSTATKPPGTVSGNGVGVPVTGPLNQCGGADLAPTDPLNFLHLQDIDVDLERVD